MPVEGKAAPHLACGTWQLSRHVCQSMWGITAGPCSRWRSAQARASTARPCSCCQEKYSAAHGSRPRMASTCMAWSVIQSSDSGLWHVHCRIISVAKHRDSCPDAWHDGLSMGSVGWLDAECRALQDVRLDVHSMRMGCTRVSLSCLLPGSARISSRICGSL